MDENMSFMDMNDDQEKIARIIAQQKPIWEPGYFNVTIVYTVS